VQHQSTDLDLAALRLALADLLDESDPAEKQARIVETFRSTYPHTIRLCYDEHARLRSGYAINCYAFALEYPHHLGSSALTSLIPMLLEKAESEVVDGGLVLYYYNDKRQGLAHAGVYRQPGRVRSKWRSGYVWDHPVFEIPTGYGEFVRYFAPFTFIGTPPHSSSSTRT
jgi:hypothetical protein